MRARLVLVLLAVAAGAAVPSAWAAFEVEWPDARVAGMAGAGGGLAGEVASLTLGDIAAGGGAPAQGWGFSFSGGRLYGLGEATGSAARAALRRPGASLAVGLSRFGSGLYAEHVASVRAARVVAGDTWCAVRLRALSISARQTAGAWSAALDAALARRILGRLFVAVACENLGQAAIGGSLISSAASLSSGIALDAFGIAMGVTSEAGFVPSLSVGCEAAACPWLTIRGGVVTEPGRFAVGLGVGDRRRAGAGSPLVDLACEWHPELGVSTFASVSYGLP